MTAPCDAKRCDIEVVACGLRPPGVNLRDIFFLFQEEVLRIRLLRLKVAEKKHGGR
ncbi:Uncharacterised protein [Raoultella planticola]|nr:Uncharacterised protein [Raoultella planticola]